MQTRFKDGSVMVCGGCSCDAALERVGEKQSRLCKVGIAVGAYEDPAGQRKTKWCNVTAWHNLASVLSRARKGDAVLVVGTLKTRTYQDKEYVELVADYVSVAAPAGPDSPPAAPMADFAVLEGDDSELPF